MSLPRLLAAATLGFFMLPAAAGAQVSPVAQQPARDRVPLAPAAGTGAIKGRVVDGQSGSPVPRAKVRLLGGPPIAMPTPGAPPAQRPPATTDDSGLFTFTALPAGNYTITVEKSTYLAGRYPEGGQTLRSSARPLTLADGQALDNVAVPLFHGGAITGRVLDAHGDPLENIEVRAMLLPKSGHGRPQNRGGGSTNDIGEYRLARLQPGRYVLQVIPRRFDFNPTEQLVAETQPIPTYYPGTLALEQAQPIAVERGATLNNVDITALDGVVSVVSGVAIDATGQPLRGSGSLNARALGETSGPFFAGPTANAPIRPDGSFQIKLPAGEYVLEARGNNGPQAFGQAQPPQPQIGTLRVSVNGDMSGLAIMLGGGAKISGKIVFEGAAEPPALPSTMNTGQMRVIFSSPDGSLCQSGRSTLNPDWTFSVEGVIGTCRAQFAGGIPRWTLKSILHDGKDLLDRAVPFEQGQEMKDVAIVFTDKRTQLNFQVADDQGNPTRDYVAVVFSTDKTRWDTNGSRYVRPYIPPQPGGGGFTLNQQLMTSTSVSATGGFTTTTTTGPGIPVQAGGGPAGNIEAIIGMPAGEYFVVALDDIDSESVRDPDTLELLSRSATRATIADTSSQVSLKRVKLADIVGR